MESTYIVSSLKDPRHAIAGWEWHELFAKNLLEISSPWSTQIQRFRWWRRRRLALAISKQVTCFWSGQAQKTTTTAETEGMLELKI